MFALILRLDCQPYINFNDRTVISQGTAQIGKSGNEASPAPINQIIAPDIAKSRFSIQLVMQSSGAFWNEAQSSFEPYCQAGGSRQ
jgi:hypothetical protein